MSRYAQNTAVSAEKSRGEIERTLVRYGATGFMYGWQGQQAMVAFQIADRHMRFLLPMPDPEADEFWKTPARGNPRSPSRLMRNGRRRHGSAGGRLRL